jgi:hypothetical protein
VTALFYRLVEISNDPLLTNPESPPQLLRWQDRDQFIPELLMLKFEIFLSLAITPHRIVLYYDRALFVTVLAVAFRHLLATGLLVSTPPMIMRRPQIRTKLQEL